MSHDKPDEVMESDQSPEGEMGVSSERVGPTGPGQVAATGVRDTSADRPEGDVPPEQRPGAEETNPEGIVPKPDRPRMDPRGDDEL